MTPLRQHLTQLKHSHTLPHYPGDLAAELLPIPITPRWRPYLAAAVAVAFIAAAVTFCIFNNPFARPRNDSMLVEEYVELMDLQLPVMPSMPVNISIVPEYQAFSLPGMPSFPSLDAGSQQQDTPTTQESV